MKYRISLVESERGWGQEYWTEEYDTLDEALARIKSVNRQNTSTTAPNHYIQAENQVEVIE